MTAPRSVASFLSSVAAGAIPTGPTLADSMLAEFVYPYPVKRFEFHSQGRPLAMAYMDIAPDRPNGKTIVLLHGKNFCGATWEATIPALRDAGYRVIVPDQIGFCKSSKPQDYQFSLHQLAANTRALLARRGVERPIVLGHSMGGMLAIRYALMYPREVGGLVLVNPIGLEDWKAKGVPLATVDELYAGEQRTNFEGIKKYQQSTYYAGQWRPEYDRWVAMLASTYQGKGGKLAAWDQALTSDMILSQPVVYELEQITVPTLLFIGERDSTAIGKNRATPEASKALGNYPILARQTQARVKGSTLVTFPDLGHAPQVQDPPRFNATLLEYLRKLPQG
ncbi:MAG: alpha/beta hydrolase [Hyphomicrobiaceae bacterium]|nr:alpha/beta hydrolase [Hyphomicrobiaceae bacterium]